LLYAANGIESAFQTRARSALYPNHVAVRQQCVWIKKHIFYRLGYGVHNEHNLLAKTIASIALLVSVANLLNSVSCSGRFTVSIGASIAAVLAGLIGFAWRQSGQISPSYLLLTSHRATVSCGVLVLLAIFTRYLAQLACGTAHGYLLVVIGLGLLSVGILAYRR
jgi:hypothetical protein